MSIWNLWAEAKLLRMLSIKHSIPLTEELLNISIVIHHKSVIKHIVCGLQVSLYEIPLRNIQTDFHNSWKFILSQTVNTSFSFSTFCYHFFFVLLLFAIANRCFSCSIFWLPFLLPHSSQQLPFHSQPLYLLLAIIRNKYAP